MIIAPIVLLLIIGSTILMLRLEIGVIARKDGVDDQINLAVKIPPFVRREVSLPVVEIVDKQGQLATRLLKTDGSGPRKEQIFTFSEQRETLNQITSLLHQIRRKGLLRSKPDSDARLPGLRWVALGAAILPKLHITVKELSLSGKFGLGDAAITGIGAGLAWAVIGFGSALVQHYLPNLNFAQPPNITITPDFDRLLFQGRLRCIVSLRLGEIILEGVKHLVRWRVFRRESGGRTASH